MEFTVTYQKVRSFEELFPNWHKRPDRNINFFTSDGLSYLEAAFDFVCDLGKGIILALQSACKKHRKVKGMYLSPFKFLNKTPTVDDLKINPVPDIIIKAWFNNIVKEMQSWIQENGLSKLNVEKEFNRMGRQLEYEWKETKDKPTKPKVKKNLNSLPDLPSDTNLGVEDDVKNYKEKIEPINLTKPNKWWNFENLKRLREIDSNPKRDGISSTRNIFEHLKKYLRKHGRGDIAKTLSLKDNRIVTSMQYRTMFLQK